MTKGIAIYSCESVYPESTAKIYSVKPTIKDIAMAVLKHQIIPALMFAMVFAFGLVCYVVAAR